MRAVLQIAGEENAELAGRQVGAVATHESDDGFAEYADKLVRGGVCSHEMSFLSHFG
jgi:hypothetical protein